MSNNALWWIVNGYFAAMVYFGFIMDDYVSRIIAIILIGITVVATLGVHVGMNTPGVDPKVVFAKNMPKNFDRSLYFDIVIIGMLIISGWYFLAGLYSYTTYVTQGPVRRVMMGSQ